MVDLLNKCSESLAISPLQLQDIMLQRDISKIHTLTYSLRFPIPKSLSSNLYYARAATPSWAPQTQMKKVTDYGNPE